MKRFGIYRARNISRRAFTLTELGIVVGCLALILGGVWVAMGAVKHQHNMEIEVARALEIVRKVRDVYSGKPNTAKPNAAAQLADCTALTPSRCLYPLDMLVNGSLRNIWGGTVEIIFGDAAFGNGMTFSVVYNGLTREVCEGFLSRIRGTSDTAVAGVSAVPLPLSSPLANETTQGGDARRVYYNNGAGWVDVTGESPTVIGNNTCTGFAAFFTM